jgi:predicted transcriptional regulator
VSGPVRIHEDARPDASAQPAPGDPISTVLEHVDRFDYSQVPVYDDAGCYAGVLTTNAIARWLAHQLVLTEGLAEREPVHHVLAFAELHEHANLVARDIAAAEAIDQLTHGGEKRTAVTALIVTDRAGQQNNPFRVITGSDLAELSVALGIGVAQ